MHVPLYEYECSGCHHRFEKIESFSAPVIQDCPQCGKKANRLLAAPAIQFKGSGWYITDYARKGSSPASSPSSNSSEKSGDGSTAGAATGEKSKSDSVSKEKPATKK
jgi:putative FmdB family regulatory protein